MRSDAQRCEPSTAPGIDAGAGFHTLVQVIRDAWIGNFFRQVQRKKSFVFVSIW